MRLIFTFTTSILLAGCVAYGPLRSEPYDYGVGYSEEIISSNIYKIRYDGRSDQTFQQLRPLLLRRAGELCPGSFSLREYTHNSDAVLHSLKFSWPYITAILECELPPIEDDAPFGRNFSKDKG